MSAENQDKREQDAESVLCSAWLDAALPCGRCARKPEVDLIDGYVVIECYTCTKEAPCAIDRDGAKAVERWNREASSELS